MALVCGYMWRLRRRAAGRCTGPYAGAAVGAMYGPCRRRASGDAAVARVVVCTVARPLVRILVRGGVRLLLPFMGRRSCGAWLCHDLGSTVPVVRTMAYPIGAYLLMWWM